MLAKRVKVINYPTQVQLVCHQFELVFLDVWGPAPTSVGKNDYYVNFIDDFCKFTWIYLLRHKSEVFQKFHDFQSMVESYYLFSKGMARFINSLEPGATSDLFFDSGASTHVTADINNL